MKINNKSTVLLALSALLVLLSACADPEASGVVKNTGNGGVVADFSVPDMLRLSRAIDQSALSLEVTVNGRKLEMVGENNQWTGVTDVSRGDDLRIVATWSEIYDGGLLELAQAGRSYTVPVNPESEIAVQFVTGDYYTGFDNDRDGNSNLAERNAGSDPSAAEFADPIVFVPLALNIQLPERLRNANGEVKNELFAAIEVDRLPVNLTRNNEQWSGEASFPTNADVLVSLTIYSSSNRDVPLARWQDTRNVGSGAALNVSASEYIYDGLNADGDELSNIQEILDGTNPLDKSDPSINPCDISFFNEGCRIDSDGDGKADSIETESANQDGDSIPDYLESSNADNDGDGFNAEQDPNDDNFCIPSENSAQCVDSRPPDQDGDGVADEDDNCPALSNADQLDVDKDGVGDACKPIVIIQDQDGDGVADEDDNCPALSNADQLDVDKDGVGDACKPIVIIQDQDGDGVADEDDNCPALSNADQLDVDKDGVGDACKPIVVIQDQDNDGVADEDDNCPALSNADQLDVDKDGVGDACKPIVVIQDQDNDGVADEDDNCPDIANDDQDDEDKDGVGDACDTPDVIDSDNDGIADDDDNCVALANAKQTDVNDNDIGDACETSLLTYEYYEGQWPKLPDFDDLDIEDTGTSATFSLPTVASSVYFGLRFEGQLYVEEAGEYTFYTESNDGSKLYIDGDLIVDNDGLHTMSEEEGAVTLSQGLHDITVEYFQHGGTTGLIVSWQGEGEAKKVISDDVLFAP